MIKMQTKKYEAIKSRDERLKAVNTFEPSKNKNARLFLDACIKKYLATEAKKSSQKLCQGSYRF